jgi:hypothetical protein
MGSTNSEELSDANCSPFKPPMQPGASSRCKSLNNFWELVAPWRGSQQPTESRRWKRSQGPRHG